MKSQGLVKHHLQVCCRCDKEPTQWKGEENREALSQALKDQALAVADKEEAVKWVAGTVRGKVRELSTGPPIGYLLCGCGQVSQFYVYPHV